MNLSHVPVSAVCSLAGAPLFYSQSPSILLHSTIDEYDNTAVVSREL